MARSARSVQVPGKLLHGVHGAGAGAGVAGLVHAQHAPVPDGGQGGVVGPGGGRLRFRVHGAALQQVHVGVQAQQFLFAQAGHPALGGDGVEAARAGDDVGDDGVGSGGQQVGVAHLEKHRGPGAVRHPRGHRVQPGAQGRFQRGGAVRFAGQDAHAAQHAEQFVERAHPEHRHGNAQRAQPFHGFARLAAALHLQHKVGGHGGHHFRAGPHVRADDRQVADGGGFLVGGSARGDAPGQVHGRQQFVERPVQGHHAPGGMGQAHLSPGVVGDGHRPVRLPGAGVGRRGQQEQGQEQGHGQRPAGAKGARRGRDRGVLVNGRMHAVSHPVPPWGGAESVRKFRTRRTAPGALRKGEKRVRKNRTVTMQVSKAAHPACNWPAARR